MTKRSDTNINQSLRHFGRRPFRWTSRPDRRMYTVRVNTRWLLKVRQALINLHRNPLTVQERLPEQLKHARRYNGMIIERRYNPLVRVRP